MRLVFAWRNLSSHEANAIKYDEDTLLSARLFGAPLMRLYPHANYWST